MAVRLSKVFGGTEQGWLVQQAQYDLAQVPRDHIKLKTAATGLAPPRFAKGRLWDKSNGDNSTPHD
jgi:plasmid maintenance system antidote protein VapI